MNVFMPPEQLTFEQSRKSIFLSVSLAVVALASAAIAIINLEDEAYSLSAYLFALAGLCMWGLFLTRRGHITPVAVGLSVLVLFVMDFNLIDGAGLHDPGVAAYPMFILFTSYLFGKRAILLSTLAGILSLSAVLVLYQFSMIDLVYEPKLSRLLILIILLLATAVFVWAVIDNWEHALAGLRDAYDSTLEGWARALGYRDQETEGHSRRVGELSAALAEKLGRGGEEIEHIRRGAYLHDIGKMAIPDGILNKPGPLDEEEWKIMKRHPELAVEMLGEISFLQPALSIPQSHHERWDGGGYPQGLAGEDIPLAARIFTIVDHWEALRSDRPYRKAWPRRKILDHIRKNAGVIYDPQVAAAFLELLEERNFI